MGKSYNNGRFLLLADTSDLNFCAIIKVCLFKNSDTKIKNSDTKICDYLLWKLKYVVGRLLCFILSVFSGFDENKNYYLM